MRIFVYDIDDEVIKRENLSSEQLINIGHIFNKVVGPQGKGIDGEIRKFEIVDELHKVHPITVMCDFHFGLAAEQVNLESLYDMFAKKLLESEKVTTGDENRRDKRIKAGALFIKEEQKRITFLKLEQIESIDPISFEETPTFGQEKNFYKAAIFEEDRYITVIDKSNKIAAYWTSRFLEIRYIQDNRFNTEYLLKLIDSNEIVRKNIDDIEFSLSLNKKIRLLLDTSSKINLRNVLQLQLENSKFNDLDFFDVYDEEKVSKISKEFGIDKEVLIRYYKRKIDLKNGVALQIVDIKEAFRNQIIRLQNGEVLLKIESTVYKNLETLEREYE